MELSDREVKYIQKLIDSDSDLDLEIIVGAINHKRDDDNKVDVDMVLSKIESLSNSDQTEKTVQIDSTDSLESEKKASKYVKRAEELRDNQNTEEHINKTTYVTQNILSELEPLIHYLLLPKAPKQYTIISGKTQAFLSQEINKYIKMGWQPLGGVSAAAFGISPVGGNQYIQAMVVY